MFRNCDQYYSTVSQFTLKTMSGICKQNYAKVCQNTFDKTKQGCSPIITSKC